MKQTYPHLKKISKKKFKEKTTIHSIFCDPLDMHQSVEIKDFIRSAKYYLKLNLEFLQFDAPRAPLED